MAKKKGPDLNSPATNPNFGAHVSNVQNMVGSASPEQRIAGIGWYKNAAQGVAHTAIGISPGTLTPHPTHGDVGITHDKPGTSPGGSAFVRNTLSDAKADEMTHARSQGQGAAEDLARSGRYAGQRSSAVNDAGRPFGAISHSPAVRNIALSTAGLSPAGPTGMTWENNARAVADVHHLSDEQFGNVAHANTIRAGTPERQAASVVAREPFKGTALNHGTTGTVEKGARAIRGEYEGVEHPLGVQKTGHFANDIYNEFSPGAEGNRSGLTGTIDKHQADVIAGTTKPWGDISKETGNNNRNSSVRAVGEDSLPNVSSDKGYAYHRDVVQEAARRDDLRPKEEQAVSWVAQKFSKDQANPRRKTVTPTSPAPSGASSAPRTAARKPLTAPHPANILNSGR